MDLASLGIGFLAGVLATIATLGTLVFFRVRRMLRGAPSLRGRLGPAALLTGGAQAPSVETDAEGFIIASKEEPQ